MKVILQENIGSLGYVGDVLEVADGYARNFLLPHKKALLANPRNVKALEHHKRVTAHKAREVERELQTMADRLSGTSLTFPVQAGKDDKLFGAVTSKDIAAKLLDEGFDVDRRTIQLSQPLKTLGTCDVGVKLYRDIIATVSVSLVAQDGVARSDNDGAAAEGGEDGDGGETGDGGDSGDGGETHDAREAGDTDESPQ